MTLPKMYLSIRHSSDAAITHCFRAASYLLLALAVLTGSAIAQFSGPALGAGDTINHRLEPTTDQAILYPISREIQLGQGDLITVHVFGIMEYNTNVRVALDGTVQLPLIGTVAIDGLSLHQAQDLIAKRLSDAGMYINPQVTILLVESPNEVVTVSGELHGVFPVAGGKRLFDILSTAGGLTQFSSHTIVINRPGLPDPIIVDLGTDPARSNRADVPVFPRDTIIVSRVGSIYLLGAFKVQGAIPIQQNSPLTLMQVAAIAGGAGFEGNADDLRLIRTTGTTRTVVKLDLKKVIRGTAPDPILQADDIIFLPSSAIKSAIKVGGIGTLLGIVSILLYTIRA